MKGEDLKNRFRTFCVRIIRMSEFLGNGTPSCVISRQIVRSVTSAAANYRAACLSKSPRDFINKLKLVEEELDETIFWLEIIIESKLLPEEKITGLKNEAHELISIIIASVKTAKNNEIAKKKVKEVKDK